LLNCLSVFTLSVGICCIFCRCTCFAISYLLFRSDFLNHLASGTLLSCAAIDCVIYGCW